MTGRTDDSDYGHAARLATLGYLLDARGYLEDGLAILTVGDDLEVTGLHREPPPTTNRLQVAMRREAPPLPSEPTVRAELFTGAELTAAIEAMRHRDRR